VRFSHNDENLIVLAHLWCNKGNLDCTTSNLAHFWCSNRNFDCTTGNLMLYNLNFHGYIKSVQNLMCATKPNFLLFWEQCAKLLSHNLKLMHFLHNDENLDCETYNLVQFWCNNKNLDWVSSNCAHFSRNYGTLDCATLNLVRFSLKMEIQVAWHQLQHIFHVIMP